MRERKKSELTVHFFHIDNNHVINIIINMIQHVLMVQMVILNINMINIMQNYPQLNYEIQ